MRWRRAVLLAHRLSMMWLNGSQHTKLCLYSMLMRLIASRDLKTTMVVARVASKAVSLNRQAVIIGQRKSLIVNSTVICKATEISMTINSTKNKINTCRMGVMHAQLQVSRNTVISILQAKGKQLKALSNCIVSTTLLTCHLALKIIKLLQS